MVTGGFRTRFGMASAVSSSSTDLVGLGRPACAYPALPLTLLDPLIADARSPRYVVKGTEWFKYVPVGIVLPGISTLFHTMLLAQIGEGEKPDLNMSLWQGAWRIWIRKAIGRGWVWLILVVGVALGLGKKVIL